MTHDEWERMSWHARQKHLSRMWRERRAAEPEDVRDEAHRIQLTIVPDPPEVILARRREWERAHEPSLVLELPPGHMAWCLQCSQPWPCPEANTSHTTTTHEGNTA